MAEAARFRVRPVLAVAVVAGAAVLASLGVWQLDRADQKRELAAALAERRAAPARRISAAPVDPATLVYLPVIARGRYEPRLQFLVSNRVWHQRIGFHVITPLRLAGGRDFLLVDRGWIPQPAPGSATGIGALAAPGGEVEVRGLAAVPSRNVFAALFGGAERIDGHAVYPQVDLEAFARTAGAPVQPVMLQLDASPEAGGYVREWPAPDLRPDTNVGYAFQWFAMACALVAVYVWTGLRRPETS